jgi:hypothetical protein
MLVCPLMGIDFEFWTGSVGMGALMANLIPRSGELDRFLTRGILKRELMEGIASK